MRPWRDNRADDLNDIDKRGETYKSAPLFFCPQVRAYACKSNIIKSTAHMTDPKELHLSKLLNLAGVVQTMRYYQIQFFKTKARSYLILAKQYEGKVDALAAEIMSEMNGKQANTLF